MNARSSETKLPPVRRTRRRDWGRILARVICVFFAIAGLVPVGVGLLVRTSWARGIATRETRKVVAKFGVDARYELDLRLWPLSVGMRNVRVTATDGGGPFLTARKATARPKIFALLAGKLAIDTIEIDKPSARVVLRDGKLANLKLDLPDTPKSDAPMKPPFSVVSASDAEIDLDIDGKHFTAHEVDADVTADEDGEGAAAYEVAIRAAEARSRIIRVLKEPAGATPGEYAVDEDTACRIDGRARIESKRIVVRRFTAYGAADLDGAEETSPGCAVQKTDKRYVEIALGHLAVGLPQHAGEYPTVDGHVKVRGPIGLVARMPDPPDVDGWIMVDVELRYTPETVIPDMAGHITANGVRVVKFNFARAIDGDFAVRRSIVTSPLIRVDIADGVAELRDVEVKPLSEHVNLKTRVDVRDVSFTSLMHDLGVSQHPHVTWDLREIHAPLVEGTLVNPLKLDGDFTAKTANFAVFTEAVDNPAKTRATGIREGNIVAKLAVRPNALEFHAINVSTGKSTTTNGLVSIGYHGALRIDVPAAKIDMSDMSPFGNVPMSGVADVKAAVTNTLSDPKIEGDLSIANYSIGEKGNGDIQFGNVTQAHAIVDQPAVILRDVRAVKGKSTYEMPTGRLDFGGGAVLRMEGTVTSKNLDIRDFFSVFHLDEDPRFAQVGGVIEANARMHLALGGPEDKCGGGFLDVQASTTVHDVNLFGEKFDEGNADFNYRWIDRAAGIDGTEIDVRSLALTKVKKEGRASLGSVLGSLSVRRGGDLRGSLVLQGYPLGRADLLGPIASNFEGAASGVARLGGTIDAYEVDADLNVTPIRIFGAPFGGSDLHVALTTKPPAPKIIGRTACGAPITAPFDKEAWLRDDGKTSGGEFIVDGRLFGGQVKLEHVVTTRQKAPVVTGRVELAKVDLTPIGKLISPVDETDPAAVQSTLGGEISGVIDIDRIAADDLSHAKVRFTPSGMRVARGGQRIEWRFPPPPQTTVFTLHDDELEFPPVTFDLAAPNGFKGAVAVKGAVRKVMHGGDLALEATLSPIDLGILVGIVPRMTRAVGTLSGSVKLSGKATQPAFEGQLRVRSGDFTIKGMPGNITDVDIDAVADENEARITRGVGHFLGGDIGVTGRMPLKGGQFGVAEANITGRQLFVAPIEGVKATVDADLQLTMNPQSTNAANRLPFIGGDVTITSFEYTKPITLELNGFTGGAKRTVVEAYDPTLDAVALGFDVRSRVPLRIRNNLVEAQLGIERAGIHVSGTNQRIGLRGELTTLPGGRFHVFANDFEVRKGSINFDDPTRIAPHLDITAVTDYRRYTNSLNSGSGATTTAGAGAGATAGSIASGGQGVSNWRITLHAYGDTDDVRIDMTSDPALSSEDIFFLLTIGLTRAEVDQVQAGSVYASAAFEAIGTVSGVDRAVKQAIPVIDDFRAGSAYSPRTGRVEPNITVGRRLAENVRARLTSGLAEDPQLRTSIEWRLGRSLTVEPSYDRIDTVSSSNVGNFGVDFRWRLEFN